MENENVNYATPEAPAVLPIAIRYGLITGLLMIIFYLVLFFTGTFGNMFLSILSLIILITGIVLAHNQFKKINGGYMSYGKGLLIGTLMAGVIGILTGVFIFIYMSFIDPAVMDSLKETQREAQIAMYEKMNLPEEKLDESIEQLEKSFTPGRQLLFQAGGGFLWGFILSLIIAAITKRNRPEFE